MLIGLDGSAGVLFSIDSTDDIKTSIYHPSLVLCAQLENIVSRPAVDRLLRLVHPNVSGVTISVHCQVTMQVLSLLDLNISKQEETLQASLHTQMSRAHQACHHPLPRNVLARSQYNNIFLATIGFICQQKRHVTESLAGSSPVCKAACHHIPSDGMNKAEVSFCTGWSHTGGLHRQASLSLRYFS